jgi:hypothetical protein
VREEYPMSVTQEEEILAEVEGDGLPSPREAEDEFEPTIVRGRE